ncbi:methyl-accepting chemotaxis protein [Caldimonas brevitalea]|uniref:Methyl-accepting chemotaxis protein n=1 Tax=Caldimonas brevitalea TaxID=413882 RepID=A0A0G3BFS9_9BURK|nr:methyl-accepting chemotaxis protein [Caldimonas brevitalea]AKJ28207.1 methyl-accepting chemotaxis protein [Caldimonas brevitalea]
MKFLSSITVKQRLALGFGFMALLLAVLAGVGHLGAVRTQALIQHNLESATARFAVAAEMRDQSMQYDVAIRNIGLASDPTVMQQDEARAKEADSRFVAALDELVATSTSEAEKSALQRVRQLRDETAPLSTKAMQLALAFQPQDAVALITSKVDPLSQQRRAVINEFAQTQKQVAKQAMDEINARAERSKAVMLLAGTLGVLGAFVCAWLVSRAITRPLAEAVHVAETVARGDLTIEVKATSRDEIGRLVEALGKMTASLRSVIGSVRSSTDSISTASSEIASGSHDLSARTEQAASSLQQTASSMEQLTGTVRQSADAARQANQLASSASAVAARGGKVVADVVTTMEEINSASKKIADIIGVIDGIAFQTNILALNAAVEAARAGEQGRGFAVVAGEVRNLAQRSAQAAKEIKSLIGASVEKVDSGARLVQDAGATMTEIVASVQRVTDIMGEITAATAEQNDGLGQINSAVGRLDQMTQQNAALVEQSAAAAESMKDQAHRLAEVVGSFKLAREAGVQARALVDKRPAAVVPPPVAAAPRTPPVAAAPKAAPVQPPAPTVAATPQALPATATAVASGSDDWETF